MRKTNEHIKVKKLRAQAAEYRKEITKTLAKLDIECTKLQVKLKKRHDYKIIELAREAHEEEETELLDNFENRQAVRDAQISFNACSDAKELALKREKITALEELAEKLDNIDHFFNLRRSENSSADSWTRASKQIYTTASSLATFGFKGATDDPVKIAFDELKTTLNKYDEDSAAMKGVTSRTKKIINGLRELAESVQFNEDDLDQGRKIKK